MQPYSERTDAMVTAYAHGRYEAAAELASDLARAADPPKHHRSGRIPRDGLIARLEQGSILRTAGDIPLSTRVFERANAIIDRIDEAAQIRAGEETAALLSNPTAMAYRGTQYDRIMLSLYLAMNHLELGNVETARNYLRQAGNRQRYAADRYREEIQQQAEEFRQSFAQRGDGADLDRGLQASGLRQAIDTQLPPPPPGFAKYESFQNPLVEFLNGAVFLAGKDDVERAVASFRRARGLEPSNGYLAALEADAEAAAKGLDIPPLVYVIYEEGLAPYREQFKIDVPLAYFANDLDSDIGRLGTPGIALPTLQWGTGASDHLVIEAGGETYATDRIASVASLVRAEFEAEYDRVLSRTIAGVLLKTAAAYAANRAADEAAEEMGGVGGLLTSVGARIGTSLYQYATNQADQRTWRTLPQEVQIAAFPAPEDGMVRVAGETVRLPTEGAEAHFIFVRQTSRYAPAVVRTATIFAPPE